jgi:hypothetical protein
MNWIIPREEPRLDACGGLGRGGVGQPTGSAELGGRVGLVSSHQASKTPCASVERVSKDVEEASMKDVDEEWGEGQRKLVEA